MVKLRELFEKLLGRVQRLFQMLLGLVFLVLALAGASVALRLWTDYRRSPNEGWLGVGFGMVASFTILLVVLGLYSFVKARSIR